MNHFKGIVLHQKEKANNKQKAKVSLYADIPCWVLGATIMSACNLGPLSAHQRNAIVVRFYMVTR